MSGAVGVPPDVVAHEAGKRGRRWWMLSILLLGQFMGLVDTFVVNVAMPIIGDDLNTSGATLQLIVGGYIVAYAMLLITGARLGALYGRRNMYLVGAAIFTLTSLGCGLAPDSTTLIVLRLFQGAGAAIMVPQIMSVIQVHFQGLDRAKALSAFGAVLAIGSVSGLVFGGIIVNADILGYGWRPVFFINVPLGILLVSLVPRLVPADERTGGVSLDLLGLLIAVVAVFAIVFPLVLGHELNWPAWTFASIAAGLVLSVLFLVYERRLTERGGAPLLNLAVFQAPSLRAGLVTLTCMQVAYGGFLFVFTLHLEFGLDYSALRTGLTYVPMSAVFGLVGFFWRRLPAPVQPFVGPIGLALCAIGYPAVAQGIAGERPGGALMWASLVLIGIGFGLSASPLLTHSLAQVPRAQAPDASGVVTTTVQLGQVLGIAAVGTIFFMVAPSTDGVIDGAAASAAALQTTSLWLVGLSLVGIAAGLILARTLNKPRQDTRKEVVSRS